jgi:hypothetical protein
MKNTLLILTLLFAGVVYYVSWIAMKRVKRRKLWALLPAAVLAPVLFFGIWESPSWLWQWHPKLDFNVVQWLAKTEKRYRYTDDIIGSGMLIGKTRDEVEQMLGHDWFYPEDTTCVGDIFRTDTTRMVYYIGDRHTASSPMARREPNSLEILPENGVIARVGEVFTDIPDGPTVRMSGFVVDPSLDTITFTGRDIVRDRYGDSLGATRIERYFERDGVRDYSDSPLPSPPGVDYRKWTKRWAHLRDSVTSVSHYSYVVERGESRTMHRYYWTDEVYISFDHHGGSGCLVRIMFDTLPIPSAKSRPAIVLETEMRIFIYSDYSENETFVPDSVFMAFSRMPIGEGRLVGRIRASKKNFYEWMGDVFFEGVFEMNLTGEYDNPGWEVTNDNI